MSGSFSVGVIAVLVGGVLQGSFFLPMKFTRRWEWENAWIIFSVVAYLIAPWILAIILVPDFPAMLSSVSARTIVVTLLYGIGWGAGALAMGNAYKYVGMAITYAIVLGIASSIGTLVPLLVMSPGQVLRPQGLSVIAAVVISLIGTAVVSWAAWQRDVARSALAADRTPRPEISSANSPVQASGTDSSLTHPERRTVMFGLGLSVAAGILASFGNLGFVFAAEISRRAAALGAGPTGSSSAVWSVLCFPIFLLNFLYCCRLLAKNKTGRLFHLSGTGSYWGLTALMGVIWLAGMAAYGSGALALGKLGTSMGWVIFMAVIILFGNVLGWITGEWKGSNRKTMVTMMAGVCILVLAVVVAGAPGFLL